MDTLKDLKKEYEATIPSATVLLDYQNNENVLINSKELAELLRCKNILDALIAAGVENWEGYEQALGCLK